jgi:fatty acid desaturase
VKEFFRALKHSITKLEEREHKLISKYAHHKIRKYHKWNQTIPFFIFICSAALVVAYYYSGLPYFTLVLIIALIITLVTYHTFNVHHRIYHKEFKKRKIKHK